MIDGGIMSQKYYGTPPRPTSEILKEGIMTIIPFGDVRIHSYMAPEAAVFANTQIIEMKRRLIVVDTQFLRPHAQEVRAYADSLKKPIERVIVTHSHPDHWFGNEFFKDTPIFALDEVTDEIRANGDTFIRDYGAAVGDAVTKEKVLPTRTVTPGIENIDGVELIYTKVNGAEAGINLAIELPGQKVLIAQDLLFNRVHGFFGQKEIDPWIDAVRGFMAKKYDLVLVGHGLPGGMQVIADMERYLLDAQGALKASRDIGSLKKALMGKYPFYQGEFILDISGRYLYGM
jgi:glyoxylase-like metal-dependent hydrolase (beta-lactamase superfamily II)